MRAPKPVLDPSEHQGVAVEWEPDGLGDQVRCATVFLTGAECKFTCSMCDLWQYTLDVPTPPGALPRQLQKAVDSIPEDSEPVRWIKLYNASNFFDETSVPQTDYADIARICGRFERVIVENHPRMFQSKQTRQRTILFANLLYATLEVALGLESIDPIAMSLLNKHMSLDDFENAVTFLLAHNISTRSFILLQAPGVATENAIEECLRTRRYALEHGIGHCSIIPTRAGSGWMSATQKLGQWSPPTANQLEQTLRQCMLADQEINSASELNAQVTTVDLWDWQSLSGHCPRCSDVRLHRLETMNLTQNLPKGDLELDCSCITRSSGS